jgi:uncharacterized protein YjiS (DUF1127 family)
MNHLKGWFAGFNAYHRVQYSLSRLSNRELADIGISSSDIDGIAIRHKRKIEDEFFKKA